MSSFSTSFTPLSMPTPQMVAAVHFVTFSTLLVVNVERYLGLGDASFVESTILE